MNQNEPIKQEMTEPAPTVSTDRSDMSDRKDTPALPGSDAARGLGILICVAVFLIMAIIGLLWFARPTESEAEKRELTEFPALTWSGFISGEWTADIGVWYADTYPLREGMIRAYHAVQSLYGIRTEQVVIGSGDDVPDGNMDDDDVPAIAPPTTGGEGGQTVGGYYLVGDTAYELYYFNKNNAKVYASLIKRAAEKLDGRAQVYDLVVPLHYTFALGTDVQEDLGVADGGAAMNYIYSGLGDKVTSVDVYTALMAHRDEYVYFRTDHHWTARGAYYAYEAFCQRAGITPTPLSSYRQMTFDGFLGTLYSKAEEPAAMKNHPDQVEAFIPIGTNVLYVYDENGERTRYTGGVVREDTDTFYANAASKYNCFTMGDHPLLEIHNEQISADRKGTSVVLVKESYGNAFAPFLVDSYEYVYIIDYRYYKGDLTEFVTDKGIDDVIFLNNAVATTESTRLGELGKLIGD